MVKHGLDVSGPKSWRNAFECVPRCVCIICCTVRDFDAVIDRFHNRVLCYTNTRGYKMHHALKLVGWGGSLNHGVYGVLRSL